MPLVWHGTFGLLATRMLLHPVEIGLWSRMVGNVRHLCHLKGIIRGRLSFDVGRRALWRDEDDDVGIVPAD
jgi:hypothetical protein